LLEVEALGKTYGDGTPALADVSFELAAGMCGLLGPNGAGKTTLLSILALTLEPSRGACRYRGLLPSAKNRPAIRRQIGFLPQELRPVAGLSGLDYLRLAAHLRGVELRQRDLERRLRFLLEAVELHEAAGRAADTYSGGMMRRLGLAQALVHGPRLLIVDEPTAGLDPEERIRFRHLVTDLAEEIPVLLSTHIVEDIEATCERLLVIDHGRLIFDGRPSRLLAEAGSGLGPEPSLDQAWAALIGSRRENAR
jgi:ABC-type multidrug transport system ATPase subunit